MEFRALGPIELWADGQPHDLGPARARGVLAILLLTPRTIVPSDVLIDRLWDSEPPPKARESLSVYIARLRGALRQAVGEDVQLIGRARGYQLDVDPESVDLHQFRRLRRQAGALAGSGDYEHAARLLREADGLWRGQALAGVRGDWVARMRGTLEEERRAAILERVECEMELGLARRPGRRAAPAAHPVPAGRDPYRAPDGRAVLDRQAGRRAEPVPGDPPPAGRRAGRRARHAAGRAAPAHPEPGTPTWRCAPRTPGRAGPPRRTRSRRGPPTSSAATASSRCSPPSPAKAPGSPCWRACPAWARPRSRCTRPGWSRTSTRTGCST